MKNRTTAQETGFRAKKQPFQKVKVQSSIRTGWKGCVAVERSLKCYLTLESRLRIILVHRRITQIADEVFERFMPDSQPASKVCDAHAHNIQNATAGYFVLRRRGSNQNCFPRDSQGQARLDLLYIQA